MFFQGLLKQTGRLRKDLIQGCDGGAGFRLLASRDLEAKHLRKLFDGLRKFQTIMFHQEAQGRAVGTTPETVIEALFGADRK